MTSSPNPDRLLAIYLNDHFAGSTAGVELARRLRAANAEDPAFAGPLADLCSEIETDRASLEQVMDRLGIRRSRIKPAGAWAGEKLGRLKLNGQLSGYSPLSRLVELELLQLGVSGKLRLWRALEQSLDASRGEFAFARLAERAIRQRDRLEQLHLEAASRAFGGAGATTPAAAPAG